MMVIKSDDIVSMQQHGTQNVGFALLTNTGTQGTYGSSTQVELLMLTNGRIWHSLNAGIKVMLVLMIHHKLKGRQISFSEDVVAVEKLLMELKM